MEIFIAYLVIINIIAAAVCVADKRKAIKQKRRISEKTLFMLSIIGGSVGMYGAMQLVRHKTKHIKFVLGIPLIIIIQLVAVYFILTKL